MTFIVKPNRLNIQLKFDGGKSVSIPGEWASNFFVDEKGSLNRRDYKDKFYVDFVKGLVWENDATQIELNKFELDVCIKAIRTEAKKNGWQIIWPSDK